MPRSTISLTSEVSNFLNEYGFEFSVQIRSSFDVLLVTVPGSRQTRAILPLEIISGSSEEAGEKTELAWRSIEAVISQDGEYPLIVTRDRWNRQKDMMQKRILAHLEVFSPIYARNCEIRRIDKAVAREFLDKAHSYGHATCRYCYGMFLKRHTGHIAEGRSITGTQDDNGRSVHDRDMVSGRDIVPGTLVAVATFSNARKWLKGDRTVRSYEWTRYACLPQARISGGMGRLLKHFIKEVRPDDIMTYADLEWSEGDVYMRLGFTPEGRKDPVMFTIDEDWRRTAVRIGQRVATAPEELRNDIGETHDAKGLTTRGTQDVITSGERQSYFRNFGSNKFRLKLTDYE